MSGKYDQYKDIIKELHEAGKSSMDIHKALKSDFNVDMPDRTIRKKIKKWFKDLTQQVEINGAFTNSEDSFKEYCEFHNLDRSSVKEYKFINHAGQAAFNITFKENVHEDINWDEVKNYIEEGLKDWDVKSSNKPTNPNGKVGIVNLSDLHLGAYIDNLIKTKDFNIKTIVDSLGRIVEIVNEKRYDVVHVHILGDLIESFTGLNHLNSWKGLDKGMHGAEAVKLVTKILGAFLSQLNNLDSVKIVGGNHDRVTSKNDEDVEAGAADLVSWGLGLKGFNVEFHPMLIKHVADGICYVLTHGHHGISRMSTKELCWDYGEKGMFNYIMEGHLHSRMEKFSGKKNFLFVKDDSVDHKRCVLASIFTGNFYSESNSWTSNAGFLITENNGFGFPNSFDYSL